MHKTYVDSQRLQHLEHPEQARREEPLKGTGVETAELAADTTRKALLEDLDPGCRRVFPKLVAD